MSEEDPLAQPMAGFCLVSGPTCSQEVQCGKEKRKQSAGMAACKRGQSIGLGPKHPISCTTPASLMCLRKSSCLNVSDCK